VGKRRECQARENLDAQVRVLRKHVQTRKGFHGSSKERKSGSRTEKDHEPLNRNLSTKALISMVKERRVAVKVGENAWKRRVLNDTGRGGRDLAKRRQGKRDVVLGLKENPNSQWGRQQKPLKKGRTPLR